MPDQPTAQTQVPSNAPHEGFRGHILGLIPAFDVASAKDTYKAISPRQKFTLFTKSSFDRMTPVSAAFNAAIDQGFNSPRGYGQGAQGFGKRYGSAVAYKFSRDFLGYFVFPVVFQQDPRYFRRGDGTKGERLRYSISRTWIVRNDRGNNTFNISEIGSAMTAAAVTNVWLPPRDREIQSTLVRAGGRIAFDMSINIIKEFWPEIRTKFKLGKH